MSSPAVARPRPTSRAADEAFEAEAAAQTLPRRRARALALSGDRVALVALGVVMAALVAITWNTWGDLNVDTGYDLVAGAKVSHADLPYLDFDYWYGPLGALLLGGVYEVTGIAVWPSVALGLVLALAAVGLTYRLARLLVAPLPAALAGALVAVAAFSNTNISYVQPHTLTGPLGMLLALGALLAAACFARDGRRRHWLVAAGVALGATALAKPESLLALGLALGGWLLVRAVVAPAGGRRAAGVDVLAVAGPAAAVALAGFGAFFAVGAVHHPLTLDELLHRDLFPTGLLDQSVSVVYDTLAPRTPSSFAALAAKLALYAAGTAGLVALGLALARRRAARTVAVAALALGGLALLVVLAARPDTLRFYLKFAFAWLPAGAAVAAAGLAFRAVRHRHDGSWSPAAQVELLVALLLVGFSATAYARFAPYPNPDHQQATAYAMPVIAVFLAWLHVRLVPRLAPGAAAPLRAVGMAWLGVLVVACGGLLVHDARQESFTIRAAHGTMTARPAEGLVFQRAVDVIQRRTRASEPILLAPQMTGLYVMTGRRDVLPQLSLLPGALATAADERTAIHTLDNAQVRLAITDRTSLDQYGRGAFGVGYDRLVGAWLRRNFDHTTTLRGPAAGGETRTLDVWQRRTQ